MRISLAWLKKLINFDQTAEQVAQALTGLGLEVAEIIESQWQCTQVVVGQILEATQHANADRLRVCKVRVRDDGTEDAPLQIVCGAPNARAGIKVAVALVGATLPGDFKIKPAKLRGVESFGMLCSSQELGIGSGFSTCDGIIELAVDAPIGQDLAQYLGLPDTLLEIELTPNRGDCLSVLGVARELMASKEFLESSQATWTDFGQQLLTMAPFDLQAAGADVYANVGARANVETDAHVGMSLDASMHAKVKAQVNDPALAPVYCLAGLAVDNSLSTPDWMKIRLLAAGLRPINLVVDITNYVMLELGQPLHAFDASKVDGAINVRLSGIGEGAGVQTEIKEMAGDADKNSPLSQFELLNGQKVSLKEGTLIIADRQKPLALAGIMGGALAAATIESKTILLESAYFQREKICLEVQDYSISTDASYRFERGVDYRLPPKALGYAIKLLQELAGGQLLDAQITISKEYLPVVAPFVLCKSRLYEMLGENFVTWQEAEAILRRLGIQVEQLAGDRLQITPPSHRFDLRIEEDALEEIARLVGYDRLAVEPIKAELNYQHLTGLAAANRHNQDGDGCSFRARHGLAANTQIFNRISDQLAALGYSEAISYSFLDRRLQQKMMSMAGDVELANPINQEMNELRNSLWISMLPLVQRNLKRRNDQVRLFELGRVFQWQQRRSELNDGVGDGSEVTDAIAQPYHLAGVVTGDYAPYQWALSSREVDFYDLKNDLEQLLERTGLLPSGKIGELRYQPSELKCLHPGCSAQIYVAGKLVGYIGRLHPMRQKELQIRQPVWVWELYLEELLAMKWPVVQGSELSKYPKIVRDLSLVVPEQIKWQEMAELIYQQATQAEIPLVDLTPFDCYHGAEMVEGCYNLAVRLVFRSHADTLTDQMVEQWMTQILESLAQCSIKLRQ